MCTKDYNHVESNLHYGLILNKLDFRYKIKYGIYSFASDCKSHISKIEFYKVFVVVEKCLAIKSSLIKYKSA